MIQEMTRGGWERRKTTFHEINRSSRRRLNWTFLRFTFMSPFVVNERISLSAWNQCELWNFLQTTLFLFRLFFPSSVMSLLKLPIIKLLLKFQKISDIEKYFSSLFLSKTKERDESSGAMRWGSTAQHTEVLSIESRKSNENRYWTAFHWELRVGEFYEISISIIVSLSFLPLIHVRIAITIQQKSSRWETDTKHWKHKCTIAMIEENTEKSRRWKREQHTIGKAWKKWKVNWPRTIGCRWSSLHVMMISLWKITALFCWEIRNYRLSLPLIFPHSLKYLLVHSLKFQPLGSF